MHDRKMWIYCSISYFASLFMVVFECVCVFANNFAFVNTNILKCYNIDFHLRVHLVYFSFFILFSLSLLFRFSLEIDDISWFRVHRKRFDQKSSCNWNFNLVFQHTDHMITFLRMDTLAILSNQHTTFEYFSDFTTTCYVWNVRIRKKKNGQKRQEENHFQKWKKLIEIIKIESMHMFWQTVRNW